jgi:hypothetical protein
MPCAPRWSPTNSAAGSRRVTYCLVCNYTAYPQVEVHLDFLTNTGNYIAVQSAAITMALLEVPVAGISLDGQMYVAVSTNFTKGRAIDRSVLTKFVPPATFQTIRTISQLPEERFIRMATHSQPGPMNPHGTGRNVYFEKRSPWKSPAPLGKRYWLK